VSGSSVNGRKFPLPLIVDHKLYWVACDSEAEGHYLEAFLNSEIVNHEIKPFQSLGLLGERDIHKKVLELPIPKYKSINERCRNISSLGKEANNKVGQFIKKNTLSGSLGKKRSKIREEIKADLNKINKEVKHLLNEK